MRGSARQFSFSRVLFGANPGDQCCACNLGLVLLRLAEPAVPGERMCTTQLLIGSGALLYGLQALVAARYLAVVEAQRSVVEVYNHTAALTILSFCSALGSTSVCMFHTIR